MYVGQKMIRDFVKVTPDTLVKDAQKMLEENKLWMLLVVEDEKLTGYVRKEDITAALPSIMTSLDKHELNYLMSKLTVGEIVRKDIKRVPPETEIEAAADMMAEMNLAGLAVVDECDNLLGYINRNVMLEVLTEEMGFRLGGSRITVDVEDRTGIIYEVAGIIANLKHSILATATFQLGTRRLIVFRVNTDDPKEITDVMKERGYKLVGPEDFKSQWCEA